MSLQQQLKDLLGGEDFEFSYYVNRGVLTFVIKHSAMYEAPTLMFATLKKVSEIFGTEEIDVDDFANQGCETYDYGSEYGHEIKIMNPTNNVNNFESFAKLV